MQLLAIRHGETDENKKGILMGQRIDASLNEVGKKQVCSLLPNLDKHIFSALYASPLQRTKETAEIISKHTHLPVELRDELKERDVGSLSGKTYDEAKDLLGSEEVGEEYEFDYHKYGRESSADVRKRLQKFLDDISAKHDGTDKTVLVVTHAGIIQLLYSLYNPPKRQDVRNVCVHEF